MKNYKYRGWLHLTVAVVCALTAVILVIFLPNTGSIVLFVVSIQQMILYAGQRKLTEMQWKTQQNDRDERYH